MRTCLLLIAFTLFSAVPSNAEESKSLTDRQISEALRDVHDRGADLYNAGEIAGGYRMYQGGLVVAKGLLSHRPATQKLITAGMEKAEQQETFNRKAFMLHELIEEVREQLKTTVDTGPEKLKIVPREKKVDPKPMAGVGEVTEGVLGRVIWQGMPVAGVDVLYVSLGRLTPRVYQTTTGSQGVYVIADIEPGKYIVTISPGANASVKKLPERYATTTTSPLVIDVVGKGQKSDFILQ